MSAEADFDLRVADRELRDMSEARMEKILLPKMATIRADLLRERQMIIYYQANPSFSRDRQNGFRHPANLIEGNLLGSQLDQIRATRAKLAGYLIRRAAVQIRGVHESIKPAFSKRL